MQTDRQIVPHIDTDSQLAFLLTFISIYTNNLVPEHSNKLSKKGVYADGF